MLFPSPLSAFAVVILMVLLLAALIALSLFPPPCLLPRPLSTATSSARNAIYLVQTTHARLRPIRHAFRYPLFYFALDLDEVESKLHSTYKHIPKWLWSWNGWAVFSIKPANYLKRTHDSGNSHNLKKQLLDLLSQRGIAERTVGSTVLITTPRVFGYAFNPLSIYYCYAKDSNTVLAVVLEVNNTFGEKHIYICDEQNATPKTLAGYHSKHMIRRSFHVSPFNNRSGVYEAHVSDPSTGKLDIILNIKRYLDGSPEATTESSPPIWLTARVWGHSYELSVRTMLYLLLTYPLTAFMTVPRILAEAWKLAYRHGLGVYQRPAQYRTPLDGSTAVWKKESAFQRFCRDKVLLHLKHQCAKHLVPLQVHFPNGHLETIGAPSETTPTELHVVSPLFFTTLLLESRDVGTGLSVSFVRGDWTCTENDLRRFLTLMLTTNSTEAKKGPKRRNRNAFMEPFSSEKFAIIPVASMRDRYRLFKGSLFVRLEQGIFKRIARFAFDPYDLKARISAYAKEAWKEGSNIELHDGPNLLVGEQDDSIHPAMRERVRFRAFYDTFRDVSGWKVTKENVSFQAE